MRVVCAPDKFKQAATAAEAADAMALGVRDAVADADVQVLPLADGGDGTLGVLTAAFPQRREATVQDPFGRDVQAGFALSEDGRSALIETAQACGLWRIEESERNPLRTHTYGVGQLILAALDAGAVELVIGLGGSATSDGGAAMLAALGASFVDVKGEPVVPDGGSLYKLASVNIDKLDARVRDARIRVLCDVMTPLLGEHGASRHFVVQKGGTTRAISILEDGLAMYAGLIESLGLPADGLVPGTGAAGGLGFALRALGAELQPGASEVLRLLDIDDVLSGARLVLTGEGAYDAQTAEGKLIAALGAACDRCEVPLVVLAGVVAADVDVPGVTAAFGISPLGARKQDCFDATPRNLRHYAAAVTRLVAQQA